MINIYIVGLNKIFIELIIDLGFSMWVDIDEEYFYFYNVRKFFFINVVVGFCIIYICVNVVMGYMYGVEFLMLYIKYKSYMIVFILLNN